MNELVRTPRPSHVESSRVFEFDLYNRASDARLEEDLHKGLTYLHREAPDIFWTPFNSGHWVVTRHGDLSKILSDDVNFSTSEQSLPRAKNPYVAIPLNLDPPAHTPYRVILMRYFSIRAVKALEAKIRTRARELIDAVKDTGRADFVRDVAIPLPVTVFMEMVGWPLSQLGEFRALVDDFFSGPSDERRDEIIATVSSEMLKMLEARRVAPTDDMMSHLLNDEIDGRKLSTDELLSICFFLFIAGLDTVANAAGFIFRHLAQSPGLQRELAEDPQRIPSFIDEGLRAFGVVNTFRLVVRDVEVSGVRMKAGEMVALMLPLAGLDERLHENPDSFDLARSAHTNMMFSSGIHLCAGHHLARMELNVLAQEWVKAIPSFAPAPDYEHEFRVGSVMALRSLRIAWPAPAAQEGA